MEAETKKCENCDAEVGNAEVACPKCGVVFADLEDAIATVSRAQTIIEKRKAAAAPPAPAPAPAPTPAPEAKKASVLTSLGKVIRKNG